MNRLVHGLYKQRIRFPIWYSSVGTRSRLGSNASNFQGRGQRLIFESPDRAADNVTDAILELLIDHRLSLSQLTPSASFGRLGCDAAESGGVISTSTSSPTLVSGKPRPAGVKNGDLVVLGNDPLGDNKLRPRLNIAGLSIDGDAKPWQDQRPSSQPPAEPPPPPSAASVGRCPFLFKTPKSRAIRRSCVSFLRPTGITKAGYGTDFSVAATGRQ